MHPKNGQNERDQLKDQSAFQRRLILRLVALCGVQTAGWGWTAFHSKVTVVPPGVSRAYEIGAGFGSADYLVDMANYVLQLLYTNSPDSVDHNNAVLLKITDPAGYGNMKVQLDAAALRLKQLKVSTVWTPAKEEVIDRKLRVKSSGRLKTYIADVLTSNLLKEFQIEFSINNSGRLHVLNAQEVVKADHSRPAGL